MQPSLRQARSSKLALCSTDVGYPTLLCPTLHYTTGQGIFCSERKVLHVGQVDQIDQIDHIKIIQILACRYDEMLYRMCVVVQIQPRKHVLDHAGHTSTASTQKHELQ